ncbi:hypothetical protein COCMIDRAFT_38739 [Bipolaris oryzae ATCC 44560]|uniref:Protein-arginine deiminase C-terminal domain-containing protein n=1 Tax=Bipolaris oryzae ATCC 44560 TaxID=930090 RepID=W6ZIF9_COCMI|nr:uncharacterized protein COCMIDRAFT_38739 [Bipolaris oryzae ATCC 44560]EUC43321.1 hypothetical protein COCMIDRAFT_38739 [Bipolaris oryzae ATCC 44560]
MRLEALLALSSFSTSLKADIRADTDRDGLIDLIGTNDSNAKATWTADSGAIFLPNIGDTDKRCSNALLKGSAVGNDKLDRCNDASDNILRSEQFLAPLLTVPMPGLPDGASGRVYIKDQVQRSNVRIFYQPSCNSTWIYVDGNTTFSAAALRKGLVLGIDGRDVRRPSGWDGRALVTFDVQSSSNGTSSDSVMLRVAPVLTHSHLDPVQQLIGVKGNETSTPYLNRFNQQLKAAVNDTGLEDDDDFYFFSGSDDIWAQDFMVPGFASMPGPDGPISLRIMIRSPQDERVAGRQLFEYYRDTSIGAVQQLGGSRDEINSGGNIETIPPYELINGTSWPAGRLILGNHDKQSHALLPFFRAQETQDPLLLDTDWLLVGHVSEFIQFVPFDSERGWVIMVSDPKVGVNMLQQIKASGQGSQRVFSRNDTVSPSPCNNFACQPIPVESTTINQILANQDFISVQEQCAKRIEANLQILKQATGVTDDEIIRLPALFKRASLSLSNTTSIANGTDALKVGALIPGVIDGLVLTGFDTYVAPNPWGPLVNGTDVFAQTITSLYNSVGLDVVFIDDWNTYHKYGGEIYRGINSVRDMDVEWCPSCQIDE